MATARKSTVKRLLLAAVAIVAIGFGAKWAIENASARKNRASLWDELRPVSLKNCKLKRVGSANDGGYLMCDNLIDGVETLYSYGIADEDNWGCELATRLKVPVHQYDCFTPHTPTCSTGGVFDLHRECVGPKTESQNGKPFDTVANQIAKNSDKGKRAILKIDVEGAEWDSLLATPDDVLERIEQMPMELHGVNEPKFVELVRKLKRQFYLVSVHYNNYACTPRAAPLPARAYQVLFVNKRLAELDPSTPGRVAGAPPDAPDNPNAPDCQPTASR